MHESKISWIDGIKGIATLSIVLVHFGTFGIENNFFSKIVSCGARGVQFFFVISAFLTFRSLENYFGDNSISIKQAFGWIVKKAIRLMPLYYLSIIIVLLFGNDSANYWLGNNSNLLSNIILHLFFLHGFNPFYINGILSIEWYIGVMFIFYLIAPFLYKKIKSLDVAVCTFAISLIVISIIQAIILRMIPANYSDGYIVNVYITNFSFFAQLPVIMLGVIFFFAYKKPMPLDSRRMSFGGGIIGVFLLEQLVVHDVLSSIFSFVLWALVCCFLMAYMKEHKNILVNNVIFNTLGKYSYGIYLFHIFLITKVQELSFITNINDKYLKWLCGYLLVVFISFIVSFILTNFLEKPVTKLILSKL